MTLSQQILLKLLNIAIGTENVADNDNFSSEWIDWQEVESLAADHFVVAMVVDALHLLSESGSSISEALDLPENEDLKFAWYGMCLSFEKDFSRKVASIAKLASFYKKNGLSMMLLKGYGLSRYYPVASHRPLGDIDIYLFGKWQEGDELMKRELLKKIDTSHHHHSVFTVNGIMVENHYDFLNRYAHGCNVRMERWLKEKATEAGSIEINLQGADIFLPSPDFNAIFLLCHSASHFVSSGQTVRQLLDWLLFVRAEGSKVAWDEVYQLLEEEGMEKYMSVLNSIGVKYFHLPAGIFPRLSDDEDIVDRVWGDILAPEFSAKENGDLFHSLWVKPLRWYSNRWKRKLCYNENSFKNFFRAIYGKLLKPSHFVH